MIDNLRIDNLSLTEADQKFLQEHPRIRVLSQVAEALLSNRYFQSESPWRQERLYLRSALAVLEGPLPTPIKTPKEPS